jgi:hypothetical protein
MGIALIIAALALFLVSKPRAAKLPDRNGALYIRHIKILRN